MHPKSHSFTPSFGSKHSQQASERGLLRIRLAWAVLTPQHTHTHTLPACLPGADIILHITKEQDHPVLAERDQRNVGWQLGDILSIHTSYYSLFSISLPDSVEEPERQASVLGRQRGSSHKHRERGMAKKKTLTKAVSRLLCLLFTDLFRVLLFLPAY